MTRIGIKVEPSTGTAGTPGEMAIWTYNIEEAWSGTSRLAIFLPGHGAGVSQFASNTVGGTLCAALAMTGRYICVAPQVLGTVAWYRQAVIDAVVAARTAGIARGAKSGKVGLVGYSMNGGAVANMVKQHPDMLAAAVTIAGALDLDWAYGTAGHTPVASPNYSAEIDASYGSYAATAGFRIWDEPATFRNKGVPWMVIHPTDDELVPYSIGADFVANVNDPLVTLHPALTGGHTGLWANLPPSDVLAHLDSGNW